LPQKTLLEIVFSAEKFYQQNIIDLYQIFNYVGTKFQMLTQ